MKTSLNVLKITDGELSLGFLYQKIRALEKWRDNENIKVYTMLPLGRKTKKGTSMTVTELITVP